MLTYKTVKYIFWSIFIGTFLYSFLIESLGIWVFIGLLTFWLSYIAFGAFRMDAKIFTPAYCSLPQANKKNLILSFDDGPDPIITPLILDILKTHHAKAVFFCIGKKIVAHPEIITRMVAEGHIVGNHSYNHSNFLGMYSTKKVRAEIERTEHAIIDCVGTSLRLYRPPFGVTNPNIAKSIKLLKMKTIGWNVRSFDTVTANRTDLLERIQKNLKNGDIVLLHDTKEVTKDILADFLLSTTKHGFTFDVNPLRTI